MKTRLSKSQNSAAELSAEVSVRDAGSRGGRATRDRYGVSFLRRIAKKGGKTTKRRWGHLYREFGRRGGRPRRPSLEEHQGEEGHIRKE